MVRKKVDVVQWLEQKDSTQMSVHLCTGKENTQRTKQGSGAAANLLNGPVSLTASAAAKAREEACIAYTGSGDSATG